MTDDWHQARVIAGQASCAIARADGAAESSTLGCETLRSTRHDNFMGESELRGRWVVVPVERGRFGLNRASGRPANAAARSSPNAAVGCV
jgi:hypothetical protein